MKKHSTALRFARVACLVVATLGSISVNLRAQVALGTGISYQGRLTDAGAPANGTYDLQFTLFDGATGGSQVGSVITLNSTTVTAGVFTVSLDFGAGAFAGAARWLQVGVRPGGASSSSFTVLAPRQALLPNPHAIFAVNAGSAATATTATTAATATTATTAANATQLGGQSASYYLDLANHTGALSVSQGGTGATSIAASPFLTKVIGTCTLGANLQKINSDGSVECSAPLTLTSTTLDSSTGDATSSIAIGSDGLGLISFYDGTNQDLKAAHCSDPACGSATLSSLDTAGNVGIFTSIAVGGDNLGLISYVDRTNNNLKVAHCADVACSSATLSTIGTIGTGGLSSLVQGRPTLTIGTDGFGLIAYNDTTNQDLMVAHCSNAACSSSTVTDLDSTNTVGKAPSVVIGTDGFGLIAYGDWTAQKVKVAHCANAACTSTTAITSFDASVEPIDSSIAIGADGFGIVAFIDVLTDNLRILHCTNTACTTSDAPSTLQTGATGGGGVAFTIGSDGLGLVGYSDDVTTAFKVLHCSNTGCTSSTSATLDSSSEFPAFAIGLDGMPLISYDYPTTSGLRSVHCVTSTCTTTTTTTLIRRR